jgi:hypothetical protein
VEYRWGLLLILLSACEPEPKGSVQIVEPEAMRFDTEQIRHEVDVYKTNPSPIGKRRMEKAFAAFDARVGELETQAQTQTDATEREAIERRIANLKNRRQIHWERSQTLYVETMPVKRAEPVAERVERVKRPMRQQPDISEPPVRIMKAEPVREWDR